MTKKERLLTVLKGEVPDQIPFSPNIGQWFEYNKNNGTLPQDLKDCNDNLDAQLKLECDIFSRNLSNFSQIEYNCETETLGEGDDEKRIQTHIIHTPYGDLSNTLVYEKKIATWYEKKHYFVDFEKQFKAVKYCIENTDYHFNYQEYDSIEQRVGDRGLILVPITETPLKKLHILAGQENATYMLFDYEDELLELFELHTQKVLDYTKQALKTNAVAFILMDNVDSLFYPPHFFEKYCTPCIKRVSELIHSEEKYLFAHACGRTKDLAKVVAESGLDGMEGITHPSIGDFPLWEAKNIHPRFIVNGGMSAAEQEIVENASERLEHYVKNLMEKMKPDRFIFASSCQTSPRTPYDNLLYFRDFCWKYGRNN